MSLDPVQVMKGQEPTATPTPNTSNGDSKGSWDSSKDGYDHIGSTKKPRSVSVCTLPVFSVVATFPSVCAQTRKFDRCTELV